MCVLAAIPNPTPPKLKALTRARAGAALAHALLTFTCIGFQCFHYSVGLIDCIVAPTWPLGRISSIAVRVQTSCK